MADLSINVQQDSFRVMDFVLGAALGVALSAGAMEIAKISDSVQAALDPPPILSVQVADEGCRPLDQTYGVTRSVQSQNARSAGLREGNVKISEQLTVQRTLDTGLIQEVMRLDDFGQVDLRGLGAWIKITDTVTAALESGGDLSVGPLTDSLKIADTVASILNPLQANLSESLKIADTITVLNTDLFTTLLETVTLVDADQDNQVELVTDETIRISDVVLGSTLNPEQTNQSESLKVQDTVTAAMGNAGDLSITAGSESLKVSDSVVTLLNPEQASTTESLKIADTVTVLLNPEQSSGFDESLKIVDVVLGPTINPEQANSSESLKVQDTPTTTLDPEQISTSESLKVQDVATIVLNPLIATTPATESIKIQDTVTAALWLAASGFDELLHVQDFPTTDLSILVSELLYVQDQVTASAGTGVLVVENLKVADSVSTLLDPEQASGFDESLKIADIVTAQITPLLAAGFDELLHVHDAVTGLTLNPLQTSGFNESLKVQDQIQVGASIQASTNESCKVSDQVLASLDTLLASITESCKVADSASTLVTPLLASGFDEQAKVSDAVVPSITPLLAQVSELLHVEDKQPNFAGPTIIDVEGSYVTKVDVGGSYLPHVDVQGQVE
ncbi:MAG: hypothetical protein V4529_17000 [Gemmatimonadota bacterium]